jgi:tetratricopeptide (TPR) repeat protein
MMDKPLRRSHAHVLVMPAAALAFASGHVSAQNPPDSASQRPLESIIVTGSRIVTPGVAVSNPVMTVDAEAIENSGVTDVTDYLKTLPALVASTDKNDAAGSNTFIGGTGLTLLDLRHLGEDRTLVLVNGRRHVAGLPGSAAVDVDTIPFALLERVDIQTGGASALYGADGVSGVVNFILRRDYEGFDVRAQYGASGEGDADTVLLSGVLGQNVDDGRGNVTVALEYSKEKRLRANDRDFAGGGGLASFLENHDDTLDDDPNVPDQIPYRDAVFWDSGPAGAVYTDFDNLQDFNGDDEPWDFGALPILSLDPLIAPIPPFYAQGGDGARLDQYIGDLTPDEDRYTFNALLTYEINPAARLFADLKYSKTKAFSEEKRAFSMGRALAMQSKWPQAAEQAQAVLTVAPRNAEARFLLANALFQQQRYEEAGGHYREYLNAQPDDVNALISGGVTMIATDRLDDAIGLFRHAVEVDPRSPRTRHVLALALLDRGDFEGAAVQAREGLGLSANDPAMRDLLGRALASALRGSAQRPKS